MQNIVQRMRSQLGFTMVELLVVIAIIGLLAAGVLAAINPIEQINKGQDTQLKSQATQLQQGIEAYYAATQRYPWVASNTAAAGLVAANAAAFTTPAATGLSGTAGSVGAGTGNWINDSTAANTMSMLEQSLLKQGFADGVVANGTKFSVSKANTADASVYVCFVPSSKAVAAEITAKCATTPTFQGCAATPQQFCLPR